MAKFIVTYQPEAYNSLSIPSLMPSSIIYSIFLTNAEKEGGLTNDKRKLDKSKFGKLFYYHRQFAKFA